MVSENKRYPSNIFARGNKNVYFFILIFSVIV